ncbi:hypothetical protein ElyMa_000507300 [Elysia marginata]|uniref:Uncharacterized protein n=1 Tax=Elysia marginata TaxID=1093978 RepID=A0AAV4FXE4_9GAST|nr:hypothetical protein ElyMa_000507300 [Elysia marginata]
MEMPGLPTRSSPGPSDGAKTAGVSSPHTSGVPEPCGPYVKLSPLRLRHGAPAPLVRMRHCQSETRADGTEDLEVLLKPLKLT